MVLIILLAATLSIDAFAVSAAHAMKGTRIPFFSKIIMCIIAAVYFAASVWCGQYIARLLSPSAASTVGIALMGCVCVWMAMQIYFGNRKNNNPSATAAVVNEKSYSISIKPLGLTLKIIKNPMLSDIDNSKTISGFEAIFLATALSIDSISVGIGYSISGSVHILAPLLVGAAQFLFMCAGGFAGNKLSKKINSDKLQFVSVFVIGLLVVMRIFI